MIRSLTLTVSAFVEIDMATTMPKMIMDDLMITNDLGRGRGGREEAVAADPGVTCWSSFGDDYCGLQPERIHLELQFLGAIQLRLAPVDPGFQE